MNEWQRFRYLHSWDGKNIQRKTVGDGISGSRVNFSLSPTVSLSNVHAFDTVSFFKKLLAESNFEPRF